MKMHVIGVKRIEGFGKESGNPFDMCSLLALVPIEAGTFGKDKAKQTTITGYGFEIGEVDLDPAAIPQFEKIQFPAHLELTTGEAWFRGKFQTIVTGVAKALALKAAG